MRRPAARQQNGLNRPTNTKRPNAFTKQCACYRRGIEIGGPSVDHCYNLANVLYRLRRKVEAVAFYRQALELDADAHQVWNNLGVVLCELRQCDEAVRAFQRTIMLAPWFADAIYNLADCLDERGQMAEARGYWQDYLRIDASSEWVLRPGAVGSFVAYDARQ